ncbi:MAG: hypothetical protein ACXWLR_07390 [Myxococcales bacterium]
MADNDDVQVIENEGGISTGDANTGVEPKPNADGSLPPTGNARNPIATDLSGKTPGSAEFGALDPARKQTPGKAEG